MTEPHAGEAFAGPPPANYERFFVPAIGAPLATDLVRAAELRPGERVLDVACGTGVVARFAARWVGDEGSVTGLDANPGMVAVARTSAPPGTPIEWREARAEDMPFSDASFDVVLCQMGLQFMPDKLAALQEMRLVLERGGRLVLNAPGPAPQMFAVLAEALARHAGREAAGFVRQVFSLHDEGEVRELLEGAGFHDLSVRSGTYALRLPEPATFLWQYVHSTPLAQAVARLDGERRGALEREVANEWQAFRKDGGMELQVRVVTADARK